VKIPQGFSSRSKDHGNRFRAESILAGFVRFLKTVKNAHEIIDIVRNDPSVGGASFHARPGLCL